MPETQSELFLFTSLETTTFPLPACCGSRTHSSYLEQMGLLQNLELFKGGHMWSGHGDTVKRSWFYLLPDTKPVQLLSLHHLWKYSIWSSMYQEHGLLKCWLPKFYVKPLSRMSSEVLRHARMDSFSAAWSLTLEWRLTQSAVSWPGKLRNLSFLQNLVEQLLNNR